MSYTYAREGSSGGYPLAFIDDDEEITPCELCGDEATEKVDIDPEGIPGRYIAELCPRCAAFERARLRNH